MLARGARQAPPGDTASDVGRPGTTQSEPDDRSSNPTSGHDETDALDAGHGLASAICCAKCAPSETSLIGNVTCAHGSLAWEQRRDGRG